MLDDKLGPVPGSPIDTIGPDETVTLETSALISEDTLNTVEVSGALEGGAE